MKIKTNCVICDDEYTTPLINEYYKNTCSDGCKKALDAKSIHHYSTAKKAKGKYYGTGKRGKNLYRLLE